MQIERGRGNIERRKERYRNIDKKRENEKGQEK